MLVNVGIVSGTESNTPCAHTHKRYVQVEVSGVSTVSRDIYVHIYVHIYGAVIFRETDLYHFREVTKIKDIVTLGRRWQKIVETFLVHVQRGQHNFLDTRIELFAEAPERVLQENSSGQKQKRKVLPGVEMPENNLTEYRCHYLVFEIGYRENNKVSLESRRHVLPTAIRRSHGAHYMNIDQLYHALVLSIVPVTELCQLSYSKRGNVAPSQIRKSQRNFTIRRDPATAAAIRSVVALHKFLSVASRDRRRKRSNVCLLVRRKRLFAFCPAFP